VIEACFAQLEPLVGTAAACRGSGRSRGRNLSNRMRQQAAWVFCGEVLVSMVVGGSLIHTLAGSASGFGRRRNRSG